MEFIGFLIIAYALSLFHFDHIVIQGAKELFGMNITSSSYYLIFAMVGVAYEFLSLILNRSTTKTIIERNINTKENE